MMNFWYLVKFLECGHFCIKYVLRKDKIKLNVSYCKQLMTIGLVARVLKEYYQSVEWYKVNNIEDLKNKGRFITLLKIRKNALHYIVVERIEDQYVYYYDPLFLFIKKAKINRFKSKWSNYCCLYIKK